MQCETVTVLPTVALESGGRRLALSSLLPTAGRAHMCLRIIPPLDQRSLVLNQPPRLNGGLTINVSEIGNHGGPRYLSRLCSPNPRCQLTAGCRTHRFCSTALANIGAWSFFPPGGLLRSFLMGLVD